MNFKYVFIMFISAKQSAEGSSTSKRACENDSKYIIRYLK